MYIIKVWNKKGELCTYLHIESTVNICILKFFPLVLNTPTEKSAKGHCNVSLVSWILYCICIYKADVFYRTAKYLSDFAVTTVVARKSEIFFALFLFFSLQSLVWSLRKTHFSSSEDYPLAVYYAVGRPDLKDPSTFSQCTEFPLHGGFKLMSPRSRVRHSN
jgi:hypothetical protein